MPTEKPKVSEDEMLEKVDEAEDDRVAAKEASEIDDEDAAVALDARDERIP